MHRLASKVESNGEAVSNGAIGFGLGRRHSKGTRHGIFVGYSDFYILFSLEY